LDRFDPHWTFPRPTRRVPSFGGRFGEALIEGTNLLTDVAPINAIPNQGAKLERDRAPVLDGEVGDAASRIHDWGSRRVPSEERSGRAGVEAGVAAPAAIFLKGGIRLQIDREEEGAEKKIRSLLRVNEHRVPPEPTEPGPVGQLALEKGSSVDITSSLDIFANRLTKADMHTIEAPLQNAMVVAAACVPRYHAARGMLRDTLRILLMVVVPHDEEALHSREGEGEVRPTAQRVGVGEIPHLAMALFGNPSVKEVAVGGGTG
jgi:hypothetical protein